MIRRGDDEPEGTRIATGAWTASLRALGALPAWASGLATAVTLLVLIGSCLHISQRVARQMMKEAQDEELSIFAVLAAQRIDADLHALLREDEQWNGELYREAVAPLREVLEASEFIKYVYTMRPSPEGLRFVLDAADPIDRDGDGVIDQARLNEFYEEPDPAMLTCVETRSVAVSPRPNTDRWGTFVSAFAPVFNSEGGLECIVGVDLTAATYLSRLSRIDAASNAALGVGGALSAVVGAFVFAVQRRRRSAERRIAESEARLRAIIEGADFLAWEFCVEDDRFTYLSFEDSRLGYARAAWLGAGFWDSALHPEDRERTTSECLAEIGAGRPHRLHYRMMAADGRVVHISDYVSAPEHREGKTIVRGVAIDVTDRKRAEDALLEATADARRLAAAIDAAADAVFLTDETGTIRRVNRAFERLSGYGREIAVGKSPGILKSGRNDEETYRELWATIRGGRAWTGRLCNRRNPDAPSVHGTEHRECYWVDVSITPMLRPEGTIEGYIAVERDVTAVVEAEKVERQRLEAAESRLRVGKALAGAGDVGERLDRALGAIVDAQEGSGIAAGALYMIEPGSGVLQRAAVRGEAWSMCCNVRSPARVAETPWRDAAEHNRVVITARLAESGEGEPEGGRERGGCIAVPLVDRWSVGTPCLGLLVLVTNDDPHRDAPRLEAFNEITELMTTAILQDRAARMAESARRDAEEANRTKSDFLANMSHEIRTPMTAILGYTELLSNTGEGPELRVQREECIATIRRNGEHLLSLINDILDLSKIEAGKLEVERVPTEPAAVLREVMSLMTFRAKQKGLTLIVRFDSAVPERIQSDPLRLRQILLNLVGNAVKFTEVGGVTVRVWLQRRGEDGECAGDRLVVSVEDTGIGIESNHVPHLFDPFMQADASTSRRFGGSGLGLPISRNLARMLDGDIEVWSKPGRGSTFTLRISTGAIEGVRMVGEEALRAVAAPTPPSAPATTGPERPLAGVGIFLAEDGPDNQKLIGHHLRKAGAEVRIFDNGRLCLEAMTSDGTVEGRLAEKPACDIVLTDIQMPEMDGYTLARTLRARGWKGRIIALTAHAMTGDEEACLAAGCDAYASKPIDRATLIEMCRSEFACAGVRTAA
ncbi:MAG: PAS domain S-box protein [Phycisphaeraceae bacterium]|nr:PAS domain S-box protein [Phycisphaeraceae bacterium]